MLHGDIAINGELIGKWSAGRLTFVKETGKVAPYKCKVILFANYDVYGKHWPERKWEGTVQHEVGLGALTLIRQLLDTAENYFREEGLY